MTEMKVMLMIFLPTVVGGFIGGLLGAQAGVLWHQNRNRDFIEKEHELRMQAIEEGKLRLM